MSGAGPIDKQKGVETVVALLRVASGPGGALGPTEEGKEFRMRGNEVLHCIRAPASGSRLQFVETLRRRDREDGRVDQGHPPFLPIRRDDTDAEAAHAHHGICGIRIRSGEVEASHHRILAGDEYLRSREGRPVAVRLKCAGEADAFGVVAAMAECRATGRCQGSYQLGWCEPMWRKPASRIRESDCG